MTLSWCHVGLVQAFLSALWSCYSPETLNQLLYLNAFEIKVTIYEGRVHEFRELRPTLKLHILSTNERDFQKPSKIAVITGKVSIARSSNNISLNLLAS